MGMKGIKARQGMRSGATLKFILNLDVAPAPNAVLRLAASDGLQHAPQTLTPQETLWPHNDGVKVIAATRLPIPLQATASKGHAHLPAPAYAFLTRTSNCRSWAVATRLCTLHSTMYHPTVSLCS